MALEPEVLLSAGAAVQALRRGDITAERYAGALLRRCETGARLNAFITLRPEQVMEAARERDRERSSGSTTGLLHGLPIPIKDSVNTCELPTTAGTEALRHFQPEEDAPVVRALRAAGALVLGKTNLHELSLGYTSYNHVFGPVRNPYDVQRSPGGSSGGTSAAVAYGMAPLGIAEDTEGSIRVPAALCGIVGFRPTTGRYSTAGCAPITPLFDQIGPHTRCVADLLLFDSALTGSTQSITIPSLRGVRLGVVRSYFFAGLDPEVEQVCSEALNRLTAAGVELVESDMPELSRLVSICTSPVQNHDLKPTLSAYLSKYRAGVSFESLVSQASPNVRHLVERAITSGMRDFVPDAQYGDIVHIHLPAIRRMFREYFERSGVAAIIFPTTALSAPLLGEDDMEVEVRGNRMSFGDAINRNISPGSTAGLPGLVLPAGITKAGLPASLELDGPHGSDGSLLRLGLALERAIGFSPLEMDVSK